MISRLLTSLIGVVLLIYGVIAAISPLPLGLPLVVLGLIMIAAANPAARPLIRRMRRKWRWFDFLVRKVGRGAPERFHATIDETDPGPEAATESKEDDVRKAPPE